MEFQYSGGEALSFIKIWKYLKYLKKLSSKTFA